MYGHVIPAVESPPNAVPMDKSRNKYILLFYPQLQGTSLKCCSQWESVSIWSSRTTEVLLLVLISKTLGCMAHSYLRYKTGVTLVQSFESLLFSV